MSKIVNAFKRAGQAVQELFKANAQFYLAPLDKHVLKVLEESGYTKEAAEKILKAYKVN